MLADPLCLSSRLKRPSKGEQGSCHFNPCFSAFSQCSSVPEFAKRVPSCHSGSSSPCCCHSSVGNTADDMGKTALRDGVGSSPSSTLCPTSRDFYVQGHLQENNTKGETKPVSKLQDPVWGNGGCGCVTVFLGREKLPRSSFQLLLDFIPIPSCTPLLFSSLSLLTSCSWLYEDTGE